MREFMELKSSLILSIGTQDMQQTKNILLQEAYLSKILVSCLNSDRSLIRDNYRILGKSNMMLDHNIVGNC